MKTVQEFWEYFSQIPEDKWTTGTWTNSVGQHCFLGHLGLQPFNSHDSYNETTRALSAIIRKTDKELNLHLPGATGPNSLDAAIVINDKFGLGGMGSPYNHLPHPKARVMAFLEDAKKACINEHLKQEQSENS